MAKEMNITCDFVEEWLVCNFPEQMMDVLLKIRTRLGSTHLEKMYIHIL